MTRSILRFAVLNSRNVNRISIASPADFARGRALRIETPPRGAFPYCLDFPRARALYVSEADAQLVQASPFYYLHLRRSARTIISVPIELGALTQAAAMQPVFLFSPGRCGSTLLSRILFEAGISSVSEPDFYTQMSSQFWSSAHNPLHPPFHKAMWNMTDDLVTVLGGRGPTVIKLRAECCRAPSMFLRATTHRPRTMVMFRAFEDWARSTGRAFRADPGKAVRKYMRALRCYAYLAKHSDCHVVRYESLLSDPASTCAALGRFLGAPITADAVARANRSDSQAETPLQRGLRRDRGDWEARLDATLRLWHSPSHAGARDRLGVQDVWSDNPLEGENSLQTML